MFILTCLTWFSAYGYSRRLKSEEFSDEGFCADVGVQMCYNLRRGELSLDRLGGEDDVVCRQVGHLFPGLATAPQTDAAAAATPQSVFLNVSVRYRTELEDLGVVAKAPVS